MKRPRVKGLYPFPSEINITVKEETNMAKPFSEHLTVNDIIRKVQARKDRLENENYQLRQHDIDLIISELDQLLNYIEKDEEYE